MGLSKSGQILVLSLIAAPAAAEPKCPSDKEVNARIETTFAATDSYYGALFKASSKWKSDCEVARKDFLALEPAATKFWTTVMDTMKWKDSLDESCHAKIKEAGQKHPKGAAIAKKYAPLEDQIKPMLERCKDHAGFQEAASKGLRVMRRKKKTAD
jgi:hypothetical protein